MFLNSLYIGNPDNISKNTGSSHIGTGTISPDHHGLFMITQGGDEDDVVAAFERIGRMCHSTSSVQYWLCRFPAGPQNAVFYFPWSVFFGVPQKQHPVWQLISRNHPGYPEKQSSGRKGIISISDRFQRITRFTGQDQKFPLYINSAQVNPGIRFGKSGIHGQLNCLAQGISSLMVLKIKFRVPESTASSLIILSPLRIRSFSVLIMGKSGSHIGFIHKLNILFTGCFFQIL